jgi:hypothetical protein
MSGGLSVARGLSRGGSLGGLIEALNGSGSREEEHVAQGDGAQDYSSGAQAQMWLGGG